MEQYQPFYSEVSTGYEVVTLSNFHLVAEVVESCDISRSTGGGQVRELTTSNHIIIVCDKIVEL